MFIRMLDEVRPQSGEDREEPGLLGGHGGKEIDPLLMSEFFHIGTLHS